MKSKELLKRILQTIILKLLSNNDRMYGYEVTQHLKKPDRWKIDAYS